MTENASAFDTQLWVLNEAFQKPGLSFPVPFSNAWNEENCSYTLDRPAIFLWLGGFLSILKQFRSKALGQSRKLHCLQVPEGRHFGKSSQDLDLPHLPKVEVFSNECLGDLNALTLFHRSLLFMMIIQTFCTCVLYSNKGKLEVELPKASVGWWNVSSSISPDPKAAASVNFSWRWSM